MFSKKKVNFWRLAFIYTGLTATILLLLWSSPNRSNSAMMGNNMGSMMKKMNMSNITIHDLIQYPVEKESINIIENHHSNSPAYSMGILTSGIIFLLLPFIIGGSIILGIIWMK